MSFAVSTADHGVGKAITFTTPALKVTVTTLGASVRNVKVLDLNGEWVEVNNHYADYQEAFDDNATYISATVGRFAGRVCNGTFTLDNKTFHTPKNQNNQHTIHGGGNAFDKKHWDYKAFNTEKDIGVAFTYVSPHMENGFPATLHCKVTYRVEKAKPQALEMLYDAYIPETSPADATVVNMFNHCYWNLNGVPDQEKVDANGAVKLAVDVRNHYLKMPLCDKVLETDNCAIPSGKVLDVSADPIFDFRQEKLLGEGITDKKRLCRDPPGFDHPFLLTGYNPANKKDALLNAEVYSPVSGITMKVYSTFSSVWIYTANNMREGANGTKGQRHGRYGSICVEPQNPPDAVNHVEDFPSDVFVRKSKPYCEKIVNVFTVGEKGRQLGGGSKL